MSDRFVTIALRAFVKAHEDALRLSRSYDTLAAKHFGFQKAAEQLPDEEAIEREIARHIETAAAAIGAAVAESSALPPTARSRTALKRKAMRPIAAVFDALYGAYTRNDAHLVWRTPLRREFVELTADASDAGFPLLTAVRRAFEEVCARHKLDPLRFNLSDMTLRTYYYRFAGALNIRTVVNASTKRGAAAKRRENQRRLRAVTAKTGTTS